MQVLDEPRAELVRSVCELIVPGCARVGAEVYVDALLARMPADDRAAVVAAFSALGGAASGGVDALRDVELAPEFQLVRALACEAFYSDFVAPGAAGPGAWEEIDFNSPLATRLHKDWSYLGVTG
ncbi:MAG TPA: hypothetical protein VG325_10935 [Solirubrobacteraceae bacterium]|jgi:hypothetical protein|nr:hypothetical protein [Solirubrobacteraceae bacterium]